MWIHNDPFGLEVNNSLNYLKLLDACNFHEIY